MTMRFAGAALAAAMALGLMGVGVEKAEAAVVSLYGFDEEGQGGFDNFLSYDTDTHKVTNITFSDDPDYGPGIPEFPYYSISTDVLSTFVVVDQKSDTASLSGYVRYDVFYVNSQTTTSVTTQYFAYISGLHEQFPYAELDAGVGIATSATVFGNAAHITPVPLPSSVALYGAAVLTLSGGAYVRRRMRRT